MLRPREKSQYANNPYAAVVAEGNLSKKIGKRFKALASQRDELNAAERAEQERISKLLSDPAVIECKDASERLIALTANTDHAQEARNIASRFGATLSVDEYRAESGVILQKMLAESKQKREALEAQMNSSVVDGAKMFNQEKIIEAEASRIPQPETGEATA